MSDNGSKTSLLGEVALLERALSYTLGSLHLVTAGALSRATPCREWDLRTLLAHMDDSLCALQEAADLGHIQLASTANNASPTYDPVAVLRSRACHLLGAWTSRNATAPASVGGCPVPNSVVASAGALEVAIHGWDVARGCGRQRPLPPALAEELIACSPLFISAEDRPVRFAAPVDVSPWASTGDRLLAFVGREPG